MILGKDIIGGVWARPVKAELDNPAVNIMGYQESPDEGSDLLQYAEPWGGQQLNPQKGKGDIELDPSMMWQGDQPPMDSDFYTSPSKSASVDPGASFAQPWGETESRPKDQGAGYGDNSILKTLPEGFGANPDDIQGQTFGIGEPNLFEGAWDSPVGDSSVRSAGAHVASKYEELAKAVNEKLASVDIDSSLIEDNYMKLFGSSYKVASVAAARGLSVTNDRVKIASMDDLFAFKRVDKNKLIHKSSNDLWGIQVDANGDTFIQRLTDLDNTIQG